MIEIGRASSEMHCDVCGRTLLTGERFVRYHRVGADDAQVCELCTEGAEARGWVREGSPTLPVQLEQRREKGLKRWFQGKPRHLTAPEPFDPELLPADPKDAVEAGVELFNESTHPRTVSGIARTLGEPRVSVVQRSHREVVVTVAWDLSWYQYRIDMLGAANGDATAPWATTSTSWTTASATGTRRRTRTAPSPWRALAPAATPES